MNAESISALSGTILSLALAYIPGLKDAYDKLPARNKALVMGLLLVLAAAGSLAWSCRAEADVFGCVSGSFEAYLRALFTALIANQGTYSLLVRRVK